MVGTREATHSSGVEQKRDEQAQGGVRNQRAVGFEGCSLKGGGEIRTVSRGTTSLGAEQSWILPLANKAFSIDSELF